MGQKSSRDPTDYATAHCRHQIRILRITMLNTTVSYDSHEIIRPSLPLAEPCERTKTHIYNILKLEASFGEMKLILLNTHLRNIGRNEAELKSIFEEVRKTEKTTNVILGVGGGPSDKEIIDIGGLNGRMVTMQKVCVKISKYEFILNDSNKHSIESITEKKFANGFRDDRFFLLPASTGKVAVHAGLFRYICIPTPYTTSFDHIVLVHDIMMKE